MRCKGPLMGAGSPAQAQPAPGGPRGRNQGDSASTPPSLLPLRVSCWTPPKAQGTVPKVGCRECGLEPQGSSHPQRAAPGQPPQRVLWDRSRLPSPDCSHACKPLALRTSGERKALYFVLKMRAMFTDIREQLGSTEADSARSKDTQPGGP